MSTDTPNGQDSNDSIDHTDEETLRRLYWGEGMTAREISEMSEVGDSAIRWNMRKYGIERRDVELDHAPYETSFNGYERWRLHKQGKAVRVHRLLAASEYGIDALDGKHVHHKNGIQWDNRPENITLVTPSEHHSIHHDGENSPNSKLSEEEAKEIKKLAKYGDKTHKEIADMFDVERSLVTMIKSGRRWGSIGEV